MKTVIYSQDLETDRTTDHYYNNTDNGIQTLLGVGHSASLTQTSAFTSATLTSPLSPILVTATGGGQGRAGVFIPSKKIRKRNGWKGKDYELGER